MAPSLHCFFYLQEGWVTLLLLCTRDLASLLAEKQGRQYSSTLHWFRCKVNFSLLRSAIMCIRGSRSTFFPSPQIDSIDPALHEAQVPAFKTSQNFIYYAISIYFSTYTFFHCLIVVRCSIVSHSYIIDTA